MSRKKFTGLIAVVFCISLFCVIQGLIQVKNEIIFGNAEIDIAIHNYLDIPDENYITVKESSSIASLELIDNEIILNHNNTGIVITTNQIDLAGVEKLKSLNSVEVDHSNAILLNFNRKNTSINLLEIKNSSILNALAGIQNLKGLKTLSISNTDLNSLEYIAKNKNIETLYLPNNQIVDSYAIEENIYNYINLYNNMIYDHRGLRKQSNVNIWADGQMLELNTILYCNWQDLKSRQIHVLVDNLFVRDNHYTGTSAKSLGYAIPGYYYILDEWWDNERGTNWYKIGNNAWICGNEGNWTELRE